MSKSEISLLQMEVTEDILYLIIQLQILCNHETNLDNCHKMLVQIRIWEFIIMLRVGSKYPVKVGIL